MTSLRHGRFPRPRSQIQATPRRKAPTNDLTPLYPCSQAASAALLTASSLCIAGSQSKRAMAESPRPWPGQGRWGMRGDGMRGRERERVRIKESESARDLHCCIHVVARGVVCCHSVVGACRMHACVSMSALDSGVAKQVCIFKIFDFLPSQRSVPADISEGGPGGQVAPPCGLPGGTTTWAIFSPGGTFVSLIRNLFPKIAQVVVPPGNSHPGQVVLPGATWPSLGL